MVQKERDGSGAAAKAPNTSVRRSKRLQDQSSRFKETSSQAKLDSITATNLPPKVSKTGRKIKQASSTASKQRTGSTKKIAKRKGFVNDSESHPDSEKRTKVDEENNAIFIEANASPKPTVNKQPSQTSADNTESNLAEQTGKSQHSPNKDLQDLGGVYAPSPKRKLDRNRAQDGSDSEPLAKSLRLSSGGSLLPI